MDEKELQALYNAMSKQFDVGDYNQFRGKMQSTQDRKRFYDAISNEGYDLGDYNQYEQRIGGVKKKSGWADGGLLSENGGKAGTSGVLSGIAKRIVKNPTESVDMAMVASSKATPQEQAKLDYGKKMVGEGEIEIDANDPLKSYITPIKNKLAEKRQRLVSDNTKTPTSKTAESISNTQLLNDKRDLDNQRFGTQQEAELFVAPKLDRTKLVMKEGVDMSSGVQGLDMFTDESIIEATPKDNMTANVATKQYIGTRKLKENIATSGTLEEAAIKNALSRGDLEAKQIAALNGNIPKSMEGVLLLDFINDPSVRELAKDNAELTNKIRQVEFDLPKTHPEAAIRILAATISNEREARGENNALLNLPGAKVSDEIVNDLVERGDLPLQYKQFYDNPAVRFAVNGRLKTPGLIENTLQSAGESFEGLGKSVADITQVRKLYSSADDRLFNVLDKDYQNFAFKPKGFVHKMSTNGGVVTGQVLPMMAGGTAMRAMNLVKNPTVGNSIMAGLQTWGENSDRALADLPDASKAEQMGYAAINTGLEIALANVLNETKLAKDLLRGARPEIKNVISKFTKKEITEGAAKGQIENIFNKAVKFAKGTTKTSIKEANEEAATQILQTANNQVFGGEPQSFSQQAEDAFDVWATTLMGSALLGMGGGVVEINKNPSMPRLVYEMASNPEKYIQVMKEQAATDPDYAKDIDTKLDNLQYIVDVKKELDGREMKEGAKEKYLLKSLSEKMLNEKATSIPDKGLKKDTEKQLATLEIEKDNLLNPDKSNTKIVQDYYDNELLPKGLMEMLEVEGKFSEAKTGEFLKQIAQQDNNLDPDFKPIEGEFKMKVPAGVPQELIDIANERWKDKIPSPATLDFDYESGEPVVSGGKATDVVVDKPLTKEAEDLINRAADKSIGDRPDMISPALEKIAKENGVEITDKTTPDDILKSLKEKQQSLPTKPKEESVSVPEEKYSIKFTTHNKEVVSGKRLTDALNKVADDWANIQKGIREEDKYASHVSEKEKDDNLAKGLERAEEIRRGENIDNFTIWQRINSELTGESVPLFSNEKTTVDETTNIEQPNKEDKQSTQSELEAQRDIEIATVKAPKMMDVNEAVPSREEVAAKSETSDKLAANKKTRQDLKNRYTEIKNLFGCLIKL